MLNKHNLSIHQFVSKDSGRYTLQGILVTPKETVATNGHVMAIVTTPGTKEENFPTIPGVELSAKFEPFILPVAAAKTIERAIPKNQTLPILEHVVIDGKATDALPEDGGVNNSAVLAVNDLENPQVFHPRKLEGKFPDWQAQVPERKKAKFTIALDASLLAKLASYAAKFTDSRSNEVHIRFYADDKAIRLDARRDDGQEFTGVLMPLRIEKGAVTY